MSDNISKTIDIIVAGQSNAVAEGGDVKDQNKFELGATIANVVVWSISKKIFEPIRFGGTRITRAGEHKVENFGPDWTLARNISRTHRDKTVRIVKVAKGATGLRDEWKPDGSGELTNILLDAVQQSGLKPDLFAWISGERDRLENPTKTSGRFEILLDKITAASNHNDMKVVWPLLTHFTNRKHQEETDNFRNMQNGMASKAGSGIRVVSFDRLTKKDNLHFDANSVLRAGRKIFLTFNG